MYDLTCYFWDRKILVCPSLDLNVQRCTLERKKKKRKINLTSFVCSMLSSSVRSVHWNTHTSSLLRLLCPQTSSVMTKTPAALVVVNHLAQKRGRCYIETGATIQVVAWWSIKEVLNMTVLFSPPLNFTAFQHLMMQLITIMGSQPGRGSCISICISLHHLS